MAENRFSFIGVTTGSSAIMRIFPYWAEHLGLEQAVMVGHDLPIHADPQAYRDLVTGLKADSLDLGALVTTHKIDLFAACRDLFDEIDPHARLCGETSCLSKRGGRLIAHAKDPITAGKSLDQIIPRGYWRNDADVLCLGAGGSGIAISLDLMERADRGDRPRRIVVVNRSSERLQAMRRIHEQVESDVAVEYVQNVDPRVNDRLMEELPAGSLVINATGMGKDTPGSPLTDGGRFPTAGVVWDLNYRGDLVFLQQAALQVSERNLSVHDGWVYFIYGWTSVMEEVFDVRFTSDDIATLSRIAADVRASG